ncbi:MAG TPA: hypothetical protein VFY36_03930, partial [Solirubrobacteraceae bacterium]|nr:hypothetical protein [Solirubrobacteraceae bacterium]
ERLHEALDDRPPRELEELYALKSQPTTPIQQRQETYKPVSVRLSPAQTFVRPRPFYEDDLR